MGQRGLRMEAGRCRPVRATSRLEVRGILWGRWLSIFLWISCFGISRVTVLTLGILAVIRQLTFFMFLYIFYEFIRVFNSSRLPTKGFFC